MTPRTTNPSARDIPSSKPPPKAIEPGQITKQRLKRGSSAARSTPANRDISLEDRIHVIAASRLINATQYAAALGLAPKEWRAVTTQASAEGLRGDVFHILPGTEHGIAKTITDNSVISGTKLFDHT
jgi:hypothetical protein